MLLRLDGIAKRIGERTLFENATLEVSAGDRVGLVGPNGAGKSTLLYIAAGEEPPDSGSVSVPRKVSVRRLRQEIDPGQGHSVREEAATALAELDRLEAELRRLEDEMARAGRDGEGVPAELAERYDRVSAAFLQGGGFEREARVAEVLAGLGFDDEARERPLHTFSGGWLMRVELAKLLLAGPEVLLLDEPTNHLDLPAIEWFEETLRGFAGAVVVVSHDRTFLRRHVDRVAELDGLGHFTLYEGAYDSYLAQREQRREELLVRKQKQDREIARLERFVERFRAKASKARQAQSRVKTLEKMERIELLPEQRRPMRLRIPAPPRSGELVIELEGIHKSYGETRVYRGTDFELHRGQRVALAGPNGAGKSTLLRIIGGVLDVDRGERRLGHNVRVAFFAQHQLEALSAECSVLEELGKSATTDDIPRLRGHLGAFLFSGDDVDKKVAVLSGGEKQRLALAKLLLRPANLLVLDEPTNHLDIAACEVLERALAAYTGTFVFVSHDRSFINALANRVVEVKKGVLREFPGNYDDYERKLQELEGPPAKPAPTPASGETTAAEAPPARAPQPRVGKQERIAQRQQERDRQKARSRIVKGIERIEAEILECEQSQEALVYKLGDPEVHRDRERAAGLEAERAGLQDTIDDLYRDWERLAIELEALDDAS